MRGSLHILISIILLVLLFVASGIAEESPSFDMDLYGYVKLDGAYDQNPSSHGNFIMWVNQGLSTKDDAQFNMTANETRFGLNATGEGYENITVAGKLEFDLYAGVSGGTVAQNKAMLQLRHAYFTLQSGNWKLLAGDYTWGWTTESSVRNFTNTTDKEAHKGFLTPLGTTDFSKELSMAKMIKPDVLVLFGKDMSIAIRQATSMGLKTSTQIVVPNLTMGMAEGGGPKVMEGVVGALPWCWKVPYQYNYPQGIKFVEDFDKKYSRYPSTSGASAYTIMYEYKNAVERAKDFDAAKVVQSLEGHSYQFLKDPQTWCAFDHQSVQTVYAVKCKPQVDVLKDKYKLDYFEIISDIKGEQAAISKSEWQENRKKNNLLPQLESLETMASK